MRPKLLDLFCCAGGAGMGYHRAGFDVLGVDIEPQPNYPFTFIQGDALEFLAAFGDTFDAIHASPPCHDHSALSRFVADDNTAWLLPAIRERLTALGKPYVIENVEGADMRNPLVLCGTQFDLNVATDMHGGYAWLRRHRLFESNVRLTPPDGHRKCTRDKKYIGVYGTGDGGKGRGWKGSFEQRKEVMGIDWMTRTELAQAIPPAYTEHIGRQLIRELVPA